MKRGFTLLEVLVALVVLAFALAGAIQMSGALVQNSTRQSQALLAQLCADNVLVQLRLAQQLPGIGDQRAPCEQGGQRFEVTASIRPTPNPAFRRVDAQVWLGAQPILRVSTVIGQY